MVKISSSTILRLFIGLGLVAILGSLLYYTLPVTWFGLIIVLLISILTAALIPLKIDNAPSQQKLSFCRQQEIALSATLIISLAAWWSVILPISITTAVRSPWGIVPVTSLLTLSLAIFSLLTLLTSTKRLSILTILLFIATFFSAVAMAAVIYPLGFGFDPFLHRATIEHIAQFGTVTPKPLYYIGEYALELTLHALGLQINLIDRLLLPILAACLLTGSTLLGLSSLTKTRSSFVLAGLLLFPLGSLISTTPQGLAYVLAASAIMLTFSSSFIPAGVLAVAACFTHPIAGIPAIIFVTTAWLLHRFSAKPSLSKLILSVATLLNIIAIPVLFILESIKSGLTINLDFSNLLNLHSWSTLELNSFFSNHFNTWYDALYLVIDNILLITLIFAIIGLIYLLKTKTLNRPANWLPMLTAGAMVLNFLILSLLFEFDFLISYERTDYALRALTLAQIFLLPLAMIGLTSINNYLQTKPLALRLTFLTLITMIGVGQIYGAYPRHDNYARSAGFNVAQADLDAVTTIDADAAGADYLVLANQSTSAAAINLYGFKKYYHNDIFYYPIPTGGPLYQDFLTMVNIAPSIETMNAAMDLAGTKVAYFAVSNYWWQADTLIAQAKLLTPTWFSVDNGAVTIFKFLR